MGYRYGREDVLFVKDKLASKFKQRDINDLYHFWRSERGTATEKGDYTNFISKLSPDSKHLEKTVTTAYDYTTHNSVIRNIAKCMKCSYSEAATIYKARVVPVCVGRFHNASAANIVSVRYHPAACNAYLYIAFSTEDYADQFELPEDDVWLVRTDHEYLELLNGELSHQDIEDLLREYAKGNYVPQLLNIVVAK